MPRTTLNAKCPHCEGPLVVLRAAPADADLRVICTDCGRGGTVPDDVLSPLRIEPNALDLAA